MYTIKVKESTMAGEVFDIIQVKEVQVRIFEKATVVWAAIRSPKMDTIASGKIEIDGEDYNDWAHSDEHITDIVLARMNLEKA
jgi:hypothetical protein